MSIIFAPHCDFVACKFGLFLYNQKIDRHISIQRDFYVLFPKYSCMKLWLIITEKWKLLVQWYLVNIWMGNGKNWKFISSVLVLFFALFTPLLFLVRNEDTNFLSKYHLPSLFQAFEVSGGNFDFGAKKIPYNASSIDLTLSQPIEKASLSGSLFSISPNIP